MLGLANTPTPSFTQVSRGMPKADGNISQSTTSNFMGKYAAGVELGLSLLLKEVEAVLLLSASSRDV